MVPYKMNSFKSKYKKRTSKPYRAKQDRYRVDTHVEDGVYNDRFYSTVYRPSVKSARAEAMKQEKYERSLVDHSMVSIWSDITPNRKKYKTSKSKFFKKKGSQK